MEKEIDVKRWPAWCNGPNGETAIVHSPDELPKGWHHPRLDKKTAPKAAKSLDL